MAEAKRSITGEVIRWLSERRGVAPRFAVEIYKCAGRKTQKRWRANATAALARDRGDQK